MIAELFSKGVLIGLTDLDIGDYHMGGIWGVFMPNEYYLNKVQKYIQVFNENNNKDFQIWESYDFQVKLANGYILEPIGGITIDDYAEMFNEPIEITLMGVPCDIIDKYFRSHP